MNAPDIINAAFSSTSSLFLLHNCHDIWKRKSVAGITIPSALFYWLCSAWSIFFNHSLNQTFSCCCSAIVCAVNTLMIVLVIKYTIKHERPIP